MRHRACSSLARKAAGWLNFSTIKPAEFINRPSALSMESVIVEEPDTIAGGSAQRRGFRVQIFEIIKRTCNGGHVIIQSCFIENYYGTQIDVAL